jgi:hypothetical protein
MKDNCFYKVKITKNNKTEIYHWGYYPYKMVLDDIKQAYKDGADAVELEMISQKKFEENLDKTQKI